MTSNELKSIANHLSDLYMSSPGDFPERFKTAIPADITARDGYIIGRLMDVYREAKQGRISKAAAKNEQKNIFGRSVLIDETVTKL